MWLASIVRSWASHFTRVTVPNGFVCNVFLLSLSHSLTLSPFLSMSFFPSRFLWQWKELVVCDNSPILPPFLMVTVAVTVSSGSNSKCLCLRTISFPDNFSLTPLFGMNNSNIAGLTPEPLSQTLLLPLFLALSVRLIDPYAHFFFHLLSNEGSAMLCHYAMLRCLPYIIMAHTQAVP